MLRKSRLSERAARQWAQGAVVWFPPTEREMFPIRRKPGERSIRAAAKLLLMECGRPEGDAGIRRANVSVGKKRADLLIRSIDDGPEILVCVPGTLRVPAEPAVAEQAD